MPDQTQPQVNQEFQHRGRYTQLRNGDWGGRLRVARQEVSEGDRVQIRKRNGDTVVRTVRRVVWGDDSTTLVAFSQYRRRAPEEQNSAEEISEEVTVQPTTPTPVNDDLTGSMLGACRAMPIDTLKEFLGQASLIYAGRLNEKKEKAQTPPEVVAEKQPSLEALKTKAEVVMAGGCHNGMGLDKPEPTLKGVNGVIEGSLNVGVTIEHPPCINGMEPEVITLEPTLIAGNGMIGGTSTACVTPPTPEKPKPASERLDLWF